MITSEQRSRKTKTAGYAMHDTNLHPDQAKMAWLRKTTEKNAR